MAYIEKYGWIPDLPDHRDRRFSIARDIELPPSIDLRSQFAGIPVYDQGALGSCTANAIAAALQFDQQVQSESLIMPSRLFIYYNERAMEGTINSDAGGMIRDGIKGVGQFGAPPETDWPYSDASDSPTDPVFIDPPSLAYSDALKMRALSYQSVGQTPVEIKSCLAGIGSANGPRPVVFGFTVYESFENDAAWQNNTMPIPNPSEAVLGGHAVLAVGYDDARQAIIVRNSWGAGWQDAGYFYMPYTYVMSPDNASDFWEVERIV